MVLWDDLSKESFRQIYTPAIAVFLLSLALISFVGSADADVPTPGVRRHDRMMLAEISVRSEPRSCGRPVPGN